ncbi:MAG: hypothetical protein R3F14_46355 [Polyangiaceae bacterium]
MQTSDVRIAAGFEGAPDITVAKALALGGLGPKPLHNFSRDDFGAPRSRSPSRPSPPTT